MLKTMKAKQFIEQTMTEAKPASLNPTGICVMCGEDEEDNWLVDTLEEFFYENITMYKEDHLPRSKAEKQAEKWSRLWASEVRRLVPDIADYKFSEGTAYGPPGPGQNMSGFELFVTSTKELGHGLMIFAGPSGEVEVVNQEFPPRFT
jgi:hypothetical protein